MQPSSMGFWFWFGIGSGFGFGFGFGWGRFDFQSVIDLTLLDFANQLCDATGMYGCTEEK